MGHVEFRIAREAEPAHARRDAALGAAVARIEHHGHAHRAAVLYGRANADFGRIRHAAMGEVAAAVEDRGVLPAGDVGLAARPADAHLFDVRRLRGLAALSAPEDR